MSMFRQNRAIKMPPVNPGSALRNLHLFVSAAASAITATAEITSGSKYRIAKKTSSIIYSHHTTPHRTIPTHHTLSVGDGAVNKHFLLTLAKCRAGKRCEDFIKVN